jgi:L-rhamnose mutarotase
MPATTADAQVIMQLYDLRREPELRKARNWYGLEFNPTCADDIMNIVMDFRADGNRYFRMVTSYWEMAATVALHGAVNEELFLDTQQEMFFVFAKLAPHLEAMREKMQSPDAMRKTETLINKSETGKKKLQDFIKRIERFRAMAAAAQKK